MSNHDLNDTIAQAGARALTDLKAHGAVIKFQPSAEAQASAKQAKAAQHKDRLDAATAMVPNTARELHRESWRDSVTVRRLADVVLAADAEERHTHLKGYKDLTANERDDITKDLAVGLRLRRKAWRTVSVMKTEAAILDGLQEYASHVFADYWGPQRAHEAMEMLATLLAGPVRNAAIESLSGRINVTALEFAQALLQCGDE